MTQDSIFLNSIIYLTAAVVSVPIAKKAGLGSVLGYLLAGIIIGPHALHLVGNEGAEIMHFAEFGVVIMLFLIGLELHPSMLWQMKRQIFGLGGLQIGITASIITVLSAFFWLNLTQAVTTGLILAISSTAIVLQTLSEKGLLKTQAGQHSFSVLLMQDISVIPILSIIALLAGEAASSGDLIVTENVVAHEGWQKFLIIIAIVAFIIIAGRFFAHYLFRFIAETKMREIFTATALLMIISITLAMNYVGLSPALGTFIAGVVLANSEYRHELENNLEPFKGLLLGLFFISVGANIDFILLKNNLLTIVFILSLLIITKLIVLYILGRAFKLNYSQNMLFTFSLAQSGEFAFVLISFATQNGIYDSFTSGVLLIVVALSMLITPLLFIINEKWIQPKLAKIDAKPPEDIIDNETNPVIIAGFGRFGMVLGRFLVANGIKATIIDNNPHNIDYLRKFGYKVYYGDITNANTLKSAGAEEAKILVITMNDRNQIDSLVNVAKRNHPHLKLIVRGIDIAHALELKNKGVDAVKQETFGSAVSLGIEALKNLDFNSYQAQRAANTFKHLGQQLMDKLQQRYSPDDPHFVMETKKFSEHLENILLMQQKHPIQDMDCAWDPESLIEEAKEHHLKQNKNEN